MCCNFLTYTILVFVCLGATARGCTGWKSLSGGEGSAHTIYDAGDGCKVSKSL